MLLSLFRKNCKVNVLFQVFVNFFNELIVRMSEMYD